MIDLKDFEIYITTKSGLQRNSIRHCISRVKIFINWLVSNNKRLCKQSTEDFFYQLRQKTNNNNTFNTYIHALRHLRNYLFHRGVMNDFFEGFKSFKRTRPPVIILSEKEVEKIININTIPKKYKGPKIEWLQYNYQTLRMFLAYSGCRLEEAISLQVQSLDLENKRAILRYTKNDEPRNVYLVQPLIKRLRRLIQNKKPEDLVFNNSRGKKIHPQDFINDLKKAAKKAGITKRVYPHLFRHTYGTLLYIATRDIALVKEVLGHKDIKSTTVYVHIADEIVKEGMLLRHPFAYKYSNPVDLIKIIEEQIKKYKLDTDKRFDFEKLKMALTEFSLALYNSILPQYRKL